MVVVSHLFFFLRKYFRGRCDSGESHRPLSGTIYFPTAPSCPYLKEKSLHHLIWLEFRFNKAIGSVLAFVNNIDLVRICV